MKAIKITIDGIDRYSVVKNEEFGFCELSERAENYIKAQSIDNNVYNGADPYNGLFGTEYGDMAVQNHMSCRSNGELSRYYIKCQVYDTTSPFVIPKDGEWEWREVIIRVVNLMED